MKVYLPFAILLITFGIIAEDGKVFVKTDPPGALVFLKDGEKTLGKTAGIIPVPQGKQTLILKLTGFKDAELEVNVQGTSIIKPDPVTLEKRQSQIDVIFAEEGWRVFIEKKSVNDAAGKIALTPCTVALAIGPHELSLAKSGFADLSQKIEVKENGTVEVNGKPVKGVSALLKSDDKPAAPEKIAAPAKKGAQPTGDSMFISILGAYQNQNKGAVPFINLCVPNDLNNGASNLFNPDIKSTMISKLPEGGVYYRGSAKIYIPEDGMYVMSNTGCEVYVDGVKYGEVGDKGTHDVKLTKGIKKLELASSNHGQPHINFATFSLSNKTTSAAVQPCNTYADLLQFLNKPINKEVPKEVTGWEPTDALRLK